MLTVKKYLPLTFIISLFLFLRIFHLLNSYNFGSDQGLGMLETYQLFEAKKITLIGLTGSSWTIAGRYIFFGSLPYYLYMPFLLVFKWNPISVAYLFIFLQLLSLLVLYLVIKKYLSPKLTFIFGLFYSAFPMMVEHSRYLWGPNLLIPLSGFLLSELIVIYKRKARIWSFLLGLTIGIGFQIHYSFFLAGLIAVIVLIHIRKQDLYYWLIFAMGIILGIANLIIFEFRHDYYNIRTIFFIISRLNGIEERGVFNFNYHYLLPVIVFFLYLVSFILLRLEKNYRKIVQIMLGAFLMISVAYILPVPTHGYTMRDGWNYMGYKKIEKIITVENKKGYNLVDLLTGDTRAMALRYLLTLSQNPPLGITEYQATDYLFVYSKDPIEKILKGILWEIDSVKPVKVVKQWDIQNGVNLYLLARIPKSK